MAEPVTDIPIPSPISDAQSPVTVDTEPALPIEERPVAPAIGPAPRERAGLLAMAWVLSAIVLATASWAAITQRHAIMTAWPASARAYLLLGLAHVPSQPARE